MHFFLRILKVFGSAAKTAYYLKKIEGIQPNWKLQYKIKCKSTENELSNLLRGSVIKKKQPIAIVAREQILGIGQNSRTWFSPKGGIWLSAYQSFQQNSQARYLVCPLQLSYVKCL